MGITCVEQSQRIIFNVEWTGTVTRPKIDKHPYCLLGHFCLS